MKQLLLLSLLLANSALLSAQLVDYNKLDSWENICFCSTNNSLHPQTVVAADNNLQLLLAMKNGLTLKQLDSLKIPYTRSQLLLLRSQRLVERNQSIYKTTIPILDKEQTAELRKQSLLVAEKIYPNIEKECKDLVAHLAKQNRSRNAFSILFSYVLDGLIWDRFEKQGLTEKRGGGDVWSGSYWFLTPKRSFGCGTNHVSSTDEKYTLKFNWSEKSTLTNGLFNVDFDALFLAIKQGNKITDKKVIDEFSPFGFFDSNTNLSIPAIEENENDMLYMLSNDIIAKLIPTFIATANIEHLKASYKFKDNSETTIIFYHEVMWDILDLLLKNRVIEMPTAFSSPEKAKTTDVADLCFMVVKNS